MADIPGIPLPPNNRGGAKHRRRVTTTRDWIERGPLVPWMYAYLRWLAEQPNAFLSVKGAHKGYSGNGAVKVCEKTAKASKLATRKISADTLRLLEQRDDAKAYFDKIRHDLQFRAREMMADDIGKNIEARREGLEVARKEMDHKAIDGYTRWVTDVAFPKKLEGEQSAPRVTIHIHGKDAQKLVARALEEPDDVQDVDYEVVEPKQLTDGEDDD